MLWIQQSFVASTAITKKKIEEKFQEAVKEAKRKRVEANKEDPSRDEEFTQAYDEIVTRDGSAK